MIALHGLTSSLILEDTGTGAPLWRHWGARLPEGVLPTPLAGRRPAASFSLDADQPFSLYPTFGNGWFAQSALLAHRAGRHFNQAFSACATEQLGSGCVCFTLRDAVAGIAVRITLTLEAGTDVLRIGTEVVNEVETPLDLLWAASGVLPLPGAAECVHGTVGRHLDEFHAETAPLDRFGWRRENRRGLTSHDTFPGAVVSLPGTTQSAGLAYGAHLAWSGNHAAIIDWIDDGRFQWQMGEWLAPGEIRLAPGAAYRTPELIAVCSTAGLDGVAQGFHAEMRRRLDWPGGAMRPRPVTVNTWEGFYFNHTPARLAPLVEAAAAIGAERFVLDDGWFHGRTDDTAALGDWWPDEARYADGLGPLIADVQAHGMEFGLWVEPEMVSPDSELLRAHPDWALHGAGRARVTARHQLVLDLGRTEVTEHIFQRLAALLAAHPIAYLKWDHNRDLAPAEGADGTPRYNAQVTATYALMARLHAAFPGVEIESCAGGGGRADAGVLRHTHRIWTSDNIDARSRVAIQRGFLRFLPPEIMGAHVGAAPAHATGRSQNLAFRAAVAMGGHLGLELDLCALSPVERDALAGWVALHKRLRATLHGGRVWLGEGQDGLFWQAQQGPGGGAMVLMVYRLDPPTFRQPPPLPLPMLAGTGAWRVSVLRPDAPDDLVATANGDLLASLGLDLPQLSAETALLLHLEQYRSPEETILQQKQN